jgi:hypothetical protein
MDTTFTSPLMYWVGIDTDSASDDQLAEFNAFYSDVHLPEVVAGNPGFVRAQRYELARPDSRGDFGPRWLAVYEMADDAAAAAYLAQNAGSPTQRASYTPLPDVWRAIAKIRWRIIWRQIAEAGSLEEPPYSIFLVGIDPPADADDAAIAEFNAFYNGTHLPEVMAAAGFGRGTRYEREHGLAHPEPGCPRYLANYEADQAVGKKLEASPPAFGGLTPGPPVWEQHVTPWRLVYNRIHSYSP